MALQKGEVEGPTGATGSPTRYFVPWPTGRLLDGVEPVRHQHRPGPLALRGVVCVKFSKLVMVRVQRFIQVTRSLSE
jgi:hypothetical protein